MEKITTRVRKWGNSLGVILPKNIVGTQDIKENSKIIITIQPMHRTRVRDIFGMLKNRMKRSTQNILNEVDKELENGS